MFSDRGNFLRQHHGHNMELNKKKILKLRSVEKLHEACSLSDKTEY